MIRGIYTLASGMLATERGLDTVANNLANVDTTGFKRDLIAAMAAPQMATVRVPARVPSSAETPPNLEPIGFESTGVMNTATFTDFSQGTIVMTGRNLDVAITGEGFFTLLDNSGNTFYTRSGAFSVDSAGFVTSMDGAFVLGEEGPIATNGASSVRFSPDGTVFVDGERVDTLRFAFFSDPGVLAKVGNNRFVGPAPDAPGTVSIESGAIEKSNVSAVASLVELIMYHRTFEAEARVLQALDDTLSGAVNRVGATPR